MQTLDAGRYPVPSSPLRLIPDGEATGRSGTDREPDDPADLALTCASRGSRMDERKCKLICRCGDFLSCSDHD